MELHRNITDSFINYLKLHGYPDECIALEWGDGRCAIDIAILAEDLVTPIAVYEVKVSKGRNSIQTGINQLKRAMQTFDIAVPCNLVFGADNDVGFEVFDVSGAVLNNEEIDIQSMLKPQQPTKPISYKNIQAGTASKKISRAARKKQRRIDSLKPICWILFPLIAIALLVLDALGIYQLTSLRLLMLGSLVVIVLIPFFSEISLKDVTLKRKGRD